MLAFTRFFYLFFGSLLFHRNLCICLHGKRWRQARRKGQTLGNQGNVTVFTFRKKRTWFNIFPLKTFFQSGEKKTDKKVFQKNSWDAVLATHGSNTTPARASLDLWSEQPSHLFFSAPNPQMRNRYQVTLFTQQSSGPQLKSSQQACASLTHPAPARVCSRGGRVPGGAGPLGERSHAGLCHPTREWWEPRQAKRWKSHCDK